MGKAISIRTITRRILWSRSTYPKNLPTACTTSPPITAQRRQSERAYASSGKSTETRPSAAQPQMQSANRKINSRKCKHKMEDGNYGSMLIIHRAFLSHGFSRVNTDNWTRYNFITVVSFHHGTPLIIPTLTRGCAARGTLADQLQNSNVHSAHQRRKLCSRTSESARP